MNDSLFVYSTNKKFNLKSSQIKVQYKQKAVVLFTYKQARYQKLNKKQYSNIF